MNTQSTGINQRDIVKQKYRESFGENEFPWLINCLTRIANQSCYLYQYITALNSKRLIWPLITSPVLILLLLVLSVPYYYQAVMLLTIFNHQLYKTSSSVFFTANMQIMQVSLLNQEVIIEKIQAVVESKLRNSNEGRTFQEKVLKHTLCLSSYKYLIAGNFSKAVLFFFMSVVLQLHLSVNEDPGKGMNFLFLGIMVCTEQDMLIVQVGLSHVQYLVFLILSFMDLI